MRVELHLVRRNGIKITEREAAGQPVLVGELQKTTRLVAKSHFVPVLQLTATGVTNGSGVVALLYEPQLSGLTHNWMRFVGYEVLTQGTVRQLVIQEWRCYVL